MTNSHPRMEREARTLAAMVLMTCRQQRHTPTGLCPECAGLLAYALERLEKCPFQPEKPTCAKCPVHCYQRQMRERMRAVMRYAGPRMLLRHPWLTLLHMLDGWRKVPDLRRGASS